MHTPCFTQGSHWAAIMPVWEGVHQATTREPGDLPAHRSLLLWLRDWPLHGMSSV